VIATPIADLIERMLAANLPHASVVDTVRAIECLTSRDAERDASRLVTVSERSKDAERAARYREKRKKNQAKQPSAAVAMAGADAVTVERDASRDGVTNPPLSILPFLSTGEPTEAKKERSVDVLNTEPRAKAKRRRRGEGDGTTRMTEDWSPDASGTQKAADRGLRLVEIEIEITKFRNYWINRTDRDSWKPRWDLAWENWLLNAKGTLNAGANGHRTNPNSGPPQTHGDAVMAGMARYAARRGKGEPAAERGTVCGRDDAAAEPDADRGATRGDREPPRQLAFMPRTNDGK
jgi:hypothetical protein